MNQLLMDDTTLKSLSVEYKGNTCISKYDS